MNSFLISYAVNYGGNVTIRDRITPMTGLTEAEVNRVRDEMSKAYDASVSIIAITKLESEVTFSVADEDRKWLQPDLTWGAFETRLRFSSREAAKAAATSALNGPDPVFGVFPNKN